MNILVKNDLKEKYDLFPEKVKKKFILSTQKLLNADSKDLKKMIRNSERVNNRINVLRGKDYRLFYIIEATDPKEPYLLILDFIVNDTEFEETYHKLLATN